MLTISRKLILNLISSLNEPHFSLTQDPSQRSTASVVVDDEKVLTFDTFFNPLKEANQLS